MTMTSTGGLMKRYNLRPRRPGTATDAATDAEHLQTTAPVTTVANESQHDNADDTAEADSVNVNYDDDSASTTKASVKALRKQLPAQYDANDNLQVAGMTTPTASTATHYEHDEERRNSTEESIARDGLRERHIFRFADLPAELRNEIYNLSLKTDLPIALCTVNSRINSEHEIKQKIYSDGRKTGLTPNLLLLNKATYVEAGAILYSNHFCFHSPKALFVFLSSLSSTPKGWLQELTISYWASSPPSMWLGGDEERAFLLPAFTALNGAASLKNLHLEFSIYTIQHACWTPRQTAMNLYSFMHFWLHDLSKEKSNISRAVELIDIKIVDFSYALVAEDRLWSFLGHEKHADESVLRTSMLREHLVQCMDGRLTRQMLSDLEPINP